MVLTPRMARRIAEHEQLCRMSEELRLKRIIKEVIAEALAERDNTQQRLNNETKNFIYGRKY